MTNIWKELTLFQLPIVNEALEDESYSNNIDPDNIPTYSQEALDKILSNIEKVQDKQFMNMLVDTFGYNDIDDNMLEHIIDVAYDVPTRAEDYTNNTLNFIFNPKNKKSSKLYKRYQKQYTIYYDSDPA